MRCDDSDRPTGCPRYFKIGSMPFYHMMHRVPTAVKLTVTVAFSILAFGAHSLVALAGLTGAELLFLLLFRSRSCSVWPKAKVFFSQTAIIVGLHLIRFGPAEGLWPGFRVSWQLFLAFLPGMIFVETTSESRITRALAKVMPCKMAFVLATCLRFVPLVVDEVRSIYEGQVLRGARILPKDILNPWNWLDVIHCLLVPAIVQSMNLAGEIALAARARDFERCTKRTCWPET